MKVFELRTVGIPECESSLGLFVNKLDADAAFAEWDEKLIKNCSSYGIDYCLNIYERVVGE